MIKKLIYILIIKILITLFIKNKYFIINQEYLLCINYMLLNFIKFNNIFILILISYIIDILLYNISLINTLSLIITYNILFNEIKIIKNLNLIDKNIFIFKFSIIIQFIKYIILFIIKKYTFLETKLILNIILYSLINNIYMFFLIS